MNLHRPSPRPECTSHNGSHLIRARKQTAMARQKIRSLVLVLGILALLCVSPAAFATHVCLFPTSSRAAGNDVVIGTAVGESGDGLGGDDFVYGRDGDDLVCGQTGNDYVYGEGGNDSVHGEWGSDVG